MKAIILGGILLSALLSNSETSFQIQHKPNTAHKNSQQEVRKQAMGEVNNIVIPGRNNKFSLLDENNIQLNVPFVHQYEDLPEERKAEIMKSACGPAALTMAFKYQGIETELIQVIDKLPSDVYVKGVMFYDLPKGSKIYNFRSITIEPTAKEIYETLRKGHPVIMNVQNYNGFIGHALVVTGIRGYRDGQAEKIIAHDPYVGPNREFVFNSPKTLKQPEGYINYIGTLKPFYVTDSSGE